MATPELSFTIRYLKAQGGLNVSASHNPPDDNGGKFYDERGGQPVQRPARLAVGQPGDDGGIGVDVDQSSLGPHILTSGYHVALSGIAMTCPVPIKVTAGEGLCILDGVTGTKKISVQGYIAP